MSRSSGRRYPCDPDNKISDLREDAKTHGFKTRKSYNDPGHVHELTFSCHAKMLLLNDGRICESFLENLDCARRSLEYEVWAYVLMSNHVHLLVWPKQEEYSISDFLHAFKLPTAKFAAAVISRENQLLAEELTVYWPNGRKEFRFWQQGGGYDRNLTSKEAIRAAYDYIHDNPVKARLVEKEEEWPWSSAAALAGRQTLLVPDSLPWP